MGTPFVPLEKEMQDREGMKWQWPPGGTASFACDNRKHIHLLPEETGLG